MRIFTARIKTVRKIGKTDIAECLPLKNKKFKDAYQIKVSTNQANRLLPFLQALVHELLHLALFVAKDVFGYNVEGRSEHRFIARIEESIAINFNMLKERKRRKR
jgi:hypothetical protein